MANVLSATLSSLPLANDRRGAILVPALVMGALMTGALFYVAAVGDAIIFRTELQNAADVTSFKSAVWHARGMNTITSLNQFMVTALAIFAVVRVARVLALIIPPLGAVLQGPAQSAELALQTPINTALRAIAAAEVGVSAAVPYVAFLDAKNTPTAANTIWPLSVSLMPPIADRVLGGETRQPRVSPAALPVEAGTFGDLCGRAVMAVPNLLISLVIDKAPGWVPDGMIRGWLKPVTDVLFDDVGVKVFSLGDGMFCQPLTGGFMRLLSFIGQTACDEMENQSSSDQQAEDDRRAAEAASSGSSGSRPQTTAGSSSSSSSSSSGGTHGSRPTTTSTSCGGAVEALTNAEKLAGFSSTPMFVWHKAKNGNPVTHIWTWALGQPRLFAETRRGIGIANGGNQPAVQPSETAVAMSEFYFDCDKTWSPDCKDDAPWAPNWTARVRRFRSPMEELQTVGLSTPLGLLDSLQAPIGETITGLIGDSLHEATGLPGDNFLTRFIGQKIGEIQLVRDLSQTVAERAGQFESATGLDRFLEPRAHVEERRVH